MATFKLRIQALEKGECNVNITATAEGKKQVTKALRVIVGDELVPTEITLSSETLNIPKGETMEFSFDSEASDFTFTNENEAIITATKVEPTEATPNA